MMPRSYDDTQITAVLVSCARCGAAYYMTVPRPLCVPCADATQRRSEVLR